MKGLKADDKPSKLMDQKHERAKCQCEREQADAERDQMMAEQGESGNTKTTESSA